MDEKTLYKETLELIRREAEMMTTLKFGTSDLELRMKSASLLKIGLLAHNAVAQLSQCLSTSGMRN